MPAKVLILGGTSDALRLADALSKLSFDVTSSLAGVTAVPVLPRGKVRHGGFGGHAGLCSYLRSDGFDVLIDATHPFATQISENAVVASTAAHVPLYRLERPPWVQQAGDSWHVVSTVDAAAASLPLKAHAFLTVGRKQLAAFFKRQDLTGVIRTIEPPTQSLPTGWHLIQGRPATEIADEVELMRANRITHLVCKNSGGPAFFKLAAARQMGVSVIMIDRPHKSSPTIGTIFTEEDSLVDQVKRSFPSSSSR